MTPKASGTTPRAIRIPDQLWRDALAVSAARGEDVSSVVRTGLERYVKRNRSLLDHPSESSATCPECGVTVTDQTPSGFYSAHDERCGGPLEEPTHEPKDGEQA
jgi:hypothetical protein